jgi:hypothetical protein
MAQLTKYFLIFVVLFTGLTGFSASNKSDEIVGSWKFMGFFYQGKLHPPLNPDLVLIFQFRPDGTDTIYWTRLNEKGFCERRGKYKIEDTFLTDEVTWVNPDNDRSCGQDPDMQVGKITRNSFAIKNDQFLLDLGLSGESFIYVFDRLIETP